MAIERVREIFADEVSQQPLPGRFRHPFAHERDADGLAAAHSREQPVHRVPQRRRVPFDELDRGQHLAMPRGLEKPHVRHIGVDHVHAVEVDTPAAQPPAELPRHDEVRDERDRAAVIQKKIVPEVGREVRLHDEVRRLAVRREDPADRRHGRAEHDGVADGGHGGGGQHQDDDQRANRQADQRHAAEDTGRHCHRRRHGNHGGLDRAAIAPEEDIGHPLEETCLCDHGDEQRQPEDEQHRVGVHEVVQAAEGQDMQPQPARPPETGQLDMPRRGTQSAERSDDDEEHPVGQRILVDLISERAEDEQRQDRRQDLGAQQPQRHRDRAAGDEDRHGHRGASQHEQRGRQHHGGRPVRGRRRWRWLAFLESGHAAVRIGTMRLSIRDGARVVV